MNSSLSTALARSTAAKTELDRRRLAPLQPQDRLTWRPLEGPQKRALESRADILFYGGAAGGGKTDLLLGAARGFHRAVIFRRVFPNLRAIIDRSREMYNAGGAMARDDSFNESLHRWKFGDGRQVHFAALQHQQDATKYQGQPYSLHAFDEVTEFSEKMVRFVIGWNRSTREGERCRVLMAGNPPTNQEGEWVIRFFAPWLDRKHPNPAAEGELRWFAVIAGKDVEMPDDREFVLDGATPVYRFDRSKVRPEEVIRPKSRTFIPARLSDNPYLADTGYASTVQAMPEPWRTQMLTGDFSVGLEEDARQVLPTAWVEEAMRRWRENASDPAAPLDAMGVDVARGGRDKTVITLRRGARFDAQTCVPGKQSPDGPAVATDVLLLRDGHDCPVNIDVIGVGSSPYDCLKAAIGSQAVPMHSSAASDARDRSGRLGFLNKRAEWWWKLREALEPGRGEGLELPDDSELKSDLCAPRFEPCSKGIKVESKDDITERLGRSPDKGDSLVYAHAQDWGNGRGMLEHYRRAAAEKAAREAEQAAAFDGNPYHSTRRRQT